MNDFRAVRIPTFRIRNNCRVLFAPHSHPQACAAAQAAEFRSPAGFGELPASTASTATQPHADDTQQNPAVFRPGRRRPPLPYARRRHHHHRSLRTGHWFILLPLRFHTARKLMNRRRAPGVDFQLATLGSSWVHGCMDKARPQSTKAREDIPCSPSSSRGTAVKIILCC